MNQGQTQDFKLITQPVEKRTYCYWCGQKLKECQSCYGKGVFACYVCKPCKGTGLICPTHDFDWS